MSSTADKSDSPITIDLTKVNLPGNIEANDLIQIEAKDRLEKIIGGIQARLENKTESDSRAHNVIFVNGTRGSGKSTFLRAMLKDICDEGKILGKTFNELAYIDPTLTETGEHIMMSLLARMDHLVQKKSDRNCKSYIAEEPAYESWRAQLKNMSSGLTLLHPSQQGKAAQGYDSFDEMVRLGKKMSNAQGGLELGNSFQELIQSALKVLDKKAFVVAFDDVDINFGNGWDVLELIRRYLCIPEVVVLITGDLQLYTQLVRDKQFRNFSETLSKNDADRASERIGMVDHLEQQYLMKVFPLSQRLSLYSISELLELTNKNNQTGINVKYMGTDSDNTVKTVGIKDAVRGMLQEGLSLDSSSASDLSLYTDTLLRLPARSVLQILTEYYAESSEASDNKPSRLSTALRGAMLGSLYKQQVDVVALENNYFPKLIEAIFNTTLEDGDFDTGFYLRPQSKEDSLRNTSMVLAAQVARVCKGRPDVVLRYLLQGPGSVTLYNMVDKNMVEKAKNSYDYKNYKDDFIKYFALGKDESSRHWALRSVAVLAEKAIELGKNGIGLGALRVNARRGKGQTKEEYQALSLFLKTIGSSEDALSWFSVSAMNSFASSRDNIGFLSVFNLIALIEQLLELVSDKPTGEIGEEEIKKTLRKIVSGNTVTLPAWMSISPTGSQSDGVVEEEDDDDDATDANADQYEACVAPIKAWLELVRDRFAPVLSPSSLLLGKVWTRFYFNLGQIKEEKIAKNPLEFMRLNIVALLNAFLVEEYSYGKKTETDKLDITMQNSTSSLVKFNEKIENIAKFSFAKRGKALLDAIDKLKSSRKDTLKDATSVRTFYRDNYCKIALNEEDNEGKENLNSFIECFPLFCTLVTCPIFRPFFFAEPQHSNVIENQVTPSRQTAIFYFQCIMAVLIKAIDKDFELDEFEQMSDFRKIAITGIFGTIKDQVEAPQAEGQKRKPRKQKLASGSPASEAPQVEVPQAEVPETSASN